LWIDEWMHGCMDGWMDGWRDGWIDGWMDGTLYLKTAFYQIKIYSNIKIRFT